MAQNSAWYGSRVNKTAFTLSRILIASYFIALACGFVEHGDRVGFASLPGLPDTLLKMLDITFVFLTAYALIVGVQTRLAALLLALYLFWFSFMTNHVFGSTQELGAFWRDLALIGGLLMISINCGAFEPIRRRRGATRRPRRVIPRDKAKTDRPNAEHAATPVAFIHRADARPDPTPSRQIPDTHLALSNGIAAYKGL